MDSAKVSRSRAQRLFEVRFPFVYLVLSALWVTGSVLHLSDPHALAPGALALSIASGVLALALGAAAVVTLVMHRRGAWPAERAPLAQESDPRLRHTA